MLLSSTLLALVLATPDAEAKRARHLGLLPFVTDTVKRVAIVVPAGEATAISADITSDSGSETVTLVESDAWLHGAATIASLPKVDADLSLTLYDEASASLLTFSGTLDADGAVSLSAVSTDTCFLKGACEGTSDPSALDIEVLAAELFPNPDGGYDVSIDFNGADAYEIAYAGVEITETTEGGCDKLTGCTLGGTTITKVEVDFDEIGAVWEGELSTDPEGEIEIDVTSYDADGKKLGSSTMTLGTMLYSAEDGAASGQSMLSAGSGGSVAMLNRGALITKMKDKIAKGDCLTVISDNNWTSTTAPTHASVELEGGETLTIPANSYQRVGFYTIELEDIVITHLKIAINGGNLILNGSSTLSILDLAAPVCVDGTCIAISENEKGTLDLAVTGYASTAAEVASSAKIGVMAYDKTGGTVGLVDTTVSFDEAIGVVFANEIAFAGDPLGLDLGGAVSLLGAEDRKGKQKTVANGDFYGSFTRTEGGELALGGMDKNDIQAKGDIIVGGEPIDFELVDIDEDGVIEGPLVVVMRVYSNGKGTRAATTASGANPGLL